jgi:DNA-binding NtrC family response regulator
VDATRRVLVIGGASDTDTVLKAVLEPRGATVERRRSHCVATRNDASPCPRVVVIDMDAEPDAVSTTLHWKSSGRVLIGSHEPALVADRERFLAKPFQFPELVRAIEDLLARQPAA